MRPEDLTQELAQLRRGQGLHAEDLVQRLGEELSTTCGILPGDDVATARDKLIERISALVEALPPDLRLAVQAAYALPPAAQLHFLKDRMAWLGEQLDRDPRTAVRRVQSGLALLAERMAQGMGEVPVEDSEYAPEGWYVDRLRSTLRLTTDPVQLLEERVVVATREGLDSVAVSWSVPKTSLAPAGYQVEVELIYGGELQPSAELSTPTYWAGHILLPRPLHVGEHHEYHVRVNTLERRHLRPYYVLSPHRRCDEFDLRVKFDVRERPKRIWQLNGVPYRLMDDEMPREPDLPIDNVGEVQVRFRNPRQGLNYGVQWVP